MEFSAVILAGGRSSRMGRNKAWLEFRNRPLIMRQIEIARRAGASRIYISAAESRDYSDLGWPVLEDNFPGLGPLAGMEKALAVLDDPLLMVLAVDMPFMTAPMLRRLFSHCNPHYGVVPRLNGKVEPLAAVYPKAAHKCLLEFIGTGFYSARQFVELNMRLGLMLPYDLPLNHAGLFANWNIPEDVLGNSNSLPQVKARQAKTH